MIKNNKKFMLLACLIFFLSLDQCFGLWATSVDDLQDGTEVAFFSLINEDNPNFQYMSNDYNHDTSTQNYGNILLRSDPGCPYTEARWVLKKQGDGSFLITTPNPNSAPYFYLFNEHPNRISVSFQPGTGETLWVFELISEGVFAFRSLETFDPPHDSVYAEGRTNGIIGSSPNAGPAYPGTLWKIRLLAPVVAPFAPSSSLNTAGNLRDVNRPPTPQKN